MMHRSGFAVPSVQSRTAFAVAASLASIVFGACEPGSIKFRFDNRTSATLCFFQSEQSEALGGCEAKVGELKVTRWEPECAPDQPETVILTVGDSGERIYSRTATCREWNETDRTFVIEQRDGEFVVTEPVPD